MDASQKARGPSRDYCPGLNGEEGHAMSSISVPEAELVRWIERCSLCDWIDGKALDEWAKTAIKESMTKRAQRIAVTAESSPFSFSQSPDEELTLEEVLFQALGAASMCWEHPEDAGVFDSTRAKVIGMALLAEVERFMRLRREGVSEGRAGSLAQSPDPGK